MTTSPKRKTCKIHYRQAVVTPSPGVASLEELLRQALETPLDGVRLRDQVTLRRLLPDEEQLDGQAMLLTRIIDPTTNPSQSYIYAILVGYRPDAEQGILAAGDGPDLDIASLSAPDGHHFIDFLVFAMIRGNHVLALSGPNAPRRALEDYLSWLLIRQAKSLALNATLVLRTKIVMGEQTKTQQRVTKVRLGGHGSPAAGRPTADLPIPQQRFGRRGFRTGRIRGALTQLFGDSAATDLLRGLDEDQEVTLQVTLGFPRTKGDPAPGVPVTQIEDAIRNLDEGDVALIGPDGSVLGDEVRSFFKGRVDMINGLPDPYSVQKLMHTAFASFVERKIIVPDMLSRPRPAG